MPRLARGSARVTSQGSLGAPFSRLLPSGARRLDFASEFTPPHPRASLSAPSGDRLGHRHSLLAPHLRLPFPLLTLAIFNPLTVVSPAGWHLLLCQSCASAPSSPTCSPFLVPALASYSLPPPTPSPAHPGSLVPEPRGYTPSRLRGELLRLGDKGRGRCGRSFSYENHGPGGLEWRKSAFSAGALWLWSILPCLLVLRAEGRAAAGGKPVPVDRRSPGESAYGSKVSRELLLLPKCLGLHSLQLFC